MPVIDLTPTAQDYLKVIWSAQEWTDQQVTTSALAARLGHSPSTVSEAIKKLTDQGLVIHARYGSVALTDIGRQAALGMVRRHRLIETFLVDYLGYTWDEVHDEAEVLEHAVSDRFVHLLEKRLGNPVRDPHGDPIPTRDGDVPPLQAAQLSKTPTGNSVRVARVSDADPDMLRYLSAVGIVLDTNITVIDSHDFAGTLTLDVEGQRLELGIPAAQAVWVTNPSQPFTSCG